ncbi:MAG: multidrug transporter ATP-binding protein [Francisellaceae bacterium]|nr:multidrug transporter ATP-binding protein [Francisellaceae bacterium]
MNDNLATQSLTDNPAVEISDLSHSFGDFKVLKKINFHINPGEMIGLIGANGAGKSTTLKLLTTLLKPQEGQVQIAGFSLANNPQAVRKNIGYVPQLVSADGGLTAFENLRLSARLYHIPKSQQLYRINEALKFIELEKSAHKLVKTFSGGMIRRLELAQALLHEPKILFLDEPTVGLDVSARQLIWKHLLNLKTQSKMAILITTHDMGEAEILCDKIAILHKGQIQAFDSINNLKAKMDIVDATLNDVFLYYSRGIIEEGGQYKDVLKTRSNAKRLG